MLHVQLHVPIAVSQRLLDECTSNASSAVIRVHSHVQEKILRHVSAPRGVVDHRCAKQVGFIRRERDEASAARFVLQNTGKCTPYMTKLILVRFK